MVKVHTLAPLTHPTTGEQFAAGVDVDVADDVAADWRADGKVAAIADEKPAQGNYTSRTGRAEAGAPEEAPPKKGKS